MYIGVTDGLIDPKHEKAMGQAVWLFLWCIKAQTKGSSFVLGGKPLTYDEMSSRSGFPARIIRRWLNTLRTHHYVLVSYLNYKMLRIEIMKPKKWNPRQVSLPLESHRPQTVNSIRPQTVNGTTINGQSKQKASRSPITTTPLPPACGGNSLESFLDYHGTVIAVQMGNRKRIPTNSEGRMQPEYYAEWLTRKGFPARVVQEPADGAVH